MVTGVSLLCSLTGLGQAGVRASRPFLSLSLLTGLYRCGPSPVRAIRNGDIHLRYDTPFVFSMVNADRVVWLLSGTRREKLQWNPSAVGNYISTKAVGSDEREDITHTYKHQEGTSGPSRFTQPLSAPI